MQRLLSSGSIQVILGSKKAPDRQVVPEPREDRRPRAPRSPARHLPTGPSAYPSGCRRRQFLLGKAKRCADRKYCVGCRFDVDSIVTTEDAIHELCHAKRFECPERWIAIVGRGDCYGMCQNSVHGGFANLIFLTCGSNGPLIGPRAPTECRIFSLTLSDCGRVILTQRLKYRVLTQPSCELLLINLVVYYSGYCRVTALTRLIERVFDPTVNKKCRLASPYLCLEPYFPPRRSA